MDENLFFNQGVDDDMKDNNLEDSNMEDADREVVTGPVDSEELNPMTMESVEETMEEVSQPEVTPQPENTYASFATYTNPVPVSAQQPVKEPVTKKEKKKQGKFLQALAFTGKAIAFGIIAGAVMVGINFASDRLMKNSSKDSTPIKTTESNNTSNLIAVPDSNNTLMQTTNQIMDVSAIVDKAMPAAVAITGNVTTTYFSFFGPGYESQSPASGSGIIIGQNDNELLIVTNAHVVNDVDNLQATFIDGKSAKLVVKGMKTNRDIAVVAAKLDDLDAETKSAISIMEVGDSNSLKMGQPVIAIGNALGEGQSSTVGWISALNRTITINGTEYENLIMTDAAINPGNSGGALLNSQGQLIGINSAKYTDEKVEGMGYAIPISAVSDIINDLMTREVRNKVDEDKIGYLGISGMNIDSSISKSYGWPMGAMITKVGEDSPAQKAGLLKNDIIVEFDKQEIKTFEELRSLLEYYAQGETVTVGYYRIENGEYELQHTDITLGSRKDAN